MVEALVLRSRGDMDGSMRAIEGRPRAFDGPGRGPGVRDGGDADPGRAACQEAREVLDRLIAQGARDGEAAGDGSSTSWGPCAALRRRVGGGAVLQQEPGRGQGEGER